MSHSVLRLSLTNKAFSPQISLELLKLAKLLYHLLQEKTPYLERGAEAYLHKDHERQLRQLRTQAQHLGCALVPQTRHYHTSRAKRREQRRQTLLQSTRGYRAI